MKFLHPRFMYIVVSDRDDSVILSSAKSIRAGKKLRAQFEHAMGQGVTVKLYKVEECTEVEQ